MTGCALVVRPSQRVTGLPSLVQHRFLAVVGEDGVAAFDVAEFLDDRFGRQDVAPGAEMPLQVADPQHHVGDGGGARVDLDAEQLVRIDDAAGEIEERLGFAEILQGVEDLPFQALEVLEGDVEKVAAAAGRVEDAHLAELAVEGLDARPRPPLSFPCRARVTAAASTASQSARSGSITVGRTRRSTYSRGV